MVKLFELFPDELKEKVIENRLTTEGIYYAFPRVKKLPLKTYRNVLSALTHFFNVKGVTKEEKEIAYKKVVQHAESFKICTMVFSKQYEQHMASLTSSCCHESKN